MAAVCAPAMACIAPADASSRMGQGHIEHDWGVWWPMKDRYGGDPLCVQGGWALDRAYRRPVQAAWLFSAAQNGGRYLRPHRPQGPRHSISRDCRGRSPVGPSSASVYRPPPGNWQSRWSTRDYLLRGQCGRCGRSRPAIFWRTGDTEKAVPALLDLSRLLTSCYTSGWREGYVHGKRTRRGRG